MGLVCDEGDVEVRAKGRGDAEFPEELVLGQHASRRALGAWERRAVRGPP